MRYANGEKFQVYRTRELQRQRCPMVLNGVANSLPTVCKWWTAKIRFDSKFNLIFWFQIYHKRFPVNLSTRYLLCIRCVHRFQYQIHFGRFLNWIISSNATISNHFQHFIFYAHAPTHYFPEQLSFIHVSHISWKKLLYYLIILTFHTLFIIYAGFLYSWRDRHSHNYVNNFTSSRLHQLGL